jgi:hypothetical protein
MPTAVQASAGTTWLLMQRYKKSLTEPIRSIRNALAKVGSFRLEKEKQKT